MKHDIYYLKKEAKPSGSMQVSKQAVQSYSTIDWLVILLRSKLFSLGWLDGFPNGCS
jgi:hypothetical protein